MMRQALKKVFRDPELITLKRYRKKTAEINKLEPDFKKLSDKQLKAKTAEFKKRLDKEQLDQILPEVFATAREAAWRVIKQRHYDVQIIGGICLHEGRVAEMKTGEGKTLVAVLPLYLNSLTGQGAHLVTVNDYLAQLGAGWMGPIYDFLGVSVGIIIPEASFIYDPKYNDSTQDDERLRHLRPCTRQEAYQADVTYGTNNEFGFDYLRDNMVLMSDQLRQRNLNYAIVDEVDSILIDEARTPLIISAPSTASSSAYQQFSQIVEGLGEDDYIKNEKRRSVVLTESGVVKVEEELGIDNLYGLDNIRTIYHLEQALRAKTLFKRDKNYVISKDGQVIIVDEFTGRLLPGRRYNEGLHQALEAKEDVPIQQESMTLAKVSFQNYFRLYDKLAGMTGTAATEKEEFYQIYQLDVISIPTNKPLIRIDQPDLIYRSEEAKFKAIVKKIKDLNKKGQPVLIGTSSIDSNESLSVLLKAAGVKHQILNAKNNTKEALIVSKAGQKGAVTLATNIAGRGTDIVLGDGVVKLGGLFVLGTERHESRRIDNQLRGRSGRQGDPGESQFYVSLEDDVVRIFNGQKVKFLINKFAPKDEEAVFQHKLFNKAIEVAQKQVEGFNFDARKNVVQYDDVMNKHRLVIYKQRRQLLEDVDVTNQINDFIEAETSRLSEIEDMSLADEIKEVFLLSEEALDRLFDSSANKFLPVLRQQIDEVYDAKKSSFGEDVFKEVQREIYFKVLDHYWMEHLENMEHMRQGVQWMSVGQKDPLVEYRRQAQLLYKHNLTINLRKDVIKTLFSAVAVERVRSRAAVETELTKAARSSINNADQIQSGVELDQEDFLDEIVAKPTVKAKTKSAKKKKRKQQRQNRKKGRR